MKSGSRGRSRRCRPRRSRHAERVHAAAGHLRPALGDDHLPVGLAVAVGVPQQRHLALGGDEQAVGRDQPAPTGDPDPRAVPSTARPRLRGRRRRCRTGGGSGRRRRGRRAGRRGEARLLMLVRPTGSGRTVKPGTSTRTVGSPATSGPGGKRARIEIKSAGVRIRTRPGFRSVAHHEAARPSAAGASRPSQHLRVGMHQPLPQLRRGNPRSPRKLRRPPLRRTGIVSRTICR